MNTPVTSALKDALHNVEDARALGDLLFLEHWERNPQPGPAAALRVSQIRRANPRLAEAIRVELNAATSS
jgi:hypothetical protein